MTGPPVGRNRKLRHNRRGLDFSGQRVTGESGGETMGYVLVFIGGGLGAMLRHGVNLAAMRLVGSSFPWSTFVINVTGSLAMGLIAGWFALKSDASQGLRLFLTTGILGGYTTFSAFSLDAVLLYERGELAAAAFYVIGSVVLSIGGLFAGLWLIRTFA
jgi:fluoride exporter